MHKDVVEPRGSWYAMASGVFDSQHKPGSCKPECEMNCQSRPAVMHACTCGCLFNAQVPCQRDVGEHGNSMLMLMNHICVHARIDGTEQFAAKTHMQLNVG